MSSKFQRIETLFKDDFNKIQNATIAVVGLGGVGATACLALVRCGVCNLIVQDFDKVSLSNYNRQVIASDDTIGMNKVDAVEKIIHSINEDCNIIKLNEIFDENSSLFNYKFDFLIDAIDSVNNKFCLIKSLLDKDIPFISSMGTAKKIDLKKLEIVNINKTCYDPIAKIIRRKLRENNITKSFMVLSSTEEVQNGETLGSYMPVTSTAGLMLADYAIKNILK